MNKKLSKGWCERARNISQTEKYNLMRLNEMNSILYAFLLAFSYFVFFIGINYLLFKNNDYKTPLIGAITFSVAYLILKRVMEHRIEKKIKK